MRSRKLPQIRDDRINLIKITKTKSALKFYFIFCFWFFFFHKIKAMNIFSQQANINLMGQLSKRGFKSRITHKKIKFDRQLAIKTDKAKPLR